jgi:hypothetical protein
VHKAILSLQSPCSVQSNVQWPVLGSHCRASNIGQKSHKWALQFARLLYPANMIKDAKRIISLLIII